MLYVIFMCTVSALCLASYECEPADNPQEKERLKYLRQDSAKKAKASTPVPVKANQTE